MSVCQKKAGGLGVLDLRVQNKALLTKILFKFFNRADTPWVNLIWNTYYANDDLPSYPTKVGSFWSRDCCSILENFKQMTVCKAGTGETIALWYDKWADDTLVTTMPHLHSYAKNKQTTLAQATNLDEDNFYDMFHLPMSSIAAQQSCCKRDDQW